MAQVCQACGNTLTEPLSSVSAKLGFTAIQYCHLCSWQRKMTWQNECTLFERTCSATGKKLISQYPSTTVFPVYERTYWNSDNWTAPSLSYNPERPFLEQYRELSQHVPRPHNQQLNTENCAYTNLSFHSANCYVSFQIFQSDGLQYCYRANKLRDSMNCFFCGDSELLYECANVHQSYNVKYSRDCENCRDSAWLYDCKNVRNSFMCWNLNNAEYCWENQQLTADEYNQRLADLKLTDPVIVKKLHEQFRHQTAQYVSTRNHTINTTDSNGAYLVNCHACSNCYYTDDSENCLNVVRGTQMKDSADSVVGGLSENCYNVLQPGWLNTAAYILSCNNSNNIFFSEYVNNCTEAMGCISIKNKKFCILNTEYTEADYRHYKTKIMAELTDSAETFFDPTYSPFQYQDTIAQLYFPKMDIKLQTPSTDQSAVADNHCRTCGKIYLVTNQERDLLKTLNAAHCGECFSCRIIRLAKPYSNLQ